MFKRTFLLASIVLLGLWVSGCGDAATVENRQPTGVDKGEVDLALSYRTKGSLNGIPMAKLDFNSTSQDLILSKDHQTALVANGDEGVHLVDISNPTNLTFIRTISVKAEILALSSNEKVLITAARFKGIKITTGPTLRELNTTIPLSLKDWVYCVTFSHDESLVYVGTKYGMSTIDISDPSEPVLLYEYNTTKSVRDITLSKDGQTAFVANGKKGLLVLDLKNPVEPVYINAMTNIEVNFVTIDTNATRAYIGADYKKVHIVDISTPLSLSLQETYRVGSTSRKIILSGDEKTMYVGVGNSMEFVDISTAQTKSIRSIALSGTVRKTCSYGDLLFATVDNSLIVFDTNDVSNPMILDKEPVGPNLYYMNLDHKGATLYVSDGGTMSALDVNDSKNIHLKSSTNINSNSKIAKIVLSSDDTLAFIPSYNNGLKIYDVKDHEDIKPIASISTPGWALSVTLSKDNKTAFVSDFQDGFSIIDLTTIDEPKKVISVDTDGETRMSVLSNDETFLYIADDSKGIKVYDVTNHSAPILVNAVTLLGCSALVLSSDAKTLFAVTYKGIHVYKVLAEELTLISVYAPRTYFKDIALVDDGTRLLSNVYRSYMELVNITDLEELTLENRYYVDGAYALQQANNTLYIVEEDAPKDAVVSVDLKSDSISLQKDFVEKTIEIIMDTQIENAEVSVVLECGDGVVVGNYSKRYDRSIDKGIFRLPVLSVSGKTGVSRLVVSVTVDNKISQRSIYVHLFEK